MGNSLRTIVLAGIVTLAAWLGYKYLLSPETKEKIKDVAQKGVEFGLDMHDKVTGNGSAANEQSRITANKEFVADQWKQAGF